MIKNIVFDMGNVLLKFDPKYNMSLIGELSKEDYDILYKETYQTVRNAYFDEGYYDEESFTKAACENLPEHLHKHMDKLIYHWNDVIRPIPGMSDLIKELKEKKYGIYLLSNANYKQNEYWKRIPGNEYFDGIVVSAYEKCIKPFPEIYNVLYKRYNLDPSECLFIDDLIINIYGAKKTGMDGIVFRGSTYELRIELKEKGVL